MNFFVRTRQKFSKLINGLFKKKQMRIGIYGPPNAGKTTLSTGLSVTGQGMQ